MANGKHLSRTDIAWTVFAYLSVMIVNAVLICRYEDGAFVSINTMFYLMPIRSVFETELSVGSLVVGVVVYAALNFAAVCFGMTLIFRERKSLRVLGAMLLLILLVTLLPVSRDPLSHVYKAIPWIPE